MYSRTQSYLQPNCDLIFAVYTTISAMNEILCTAHAWNVNSMSRMAHTIVMFILGAIARKVCLRNGLWVAFLIVRLLLLSKIFYFCCFVLFNIDWVNLAERLLKSNILLIFSEMPFKWSHFQIDKLVICYIFLRFLHCFPFVSIPNSNNNILTIITF